MAMDNMEASVKAIKRRLGAHSGISHFSDRSGTAFRCQLSKYVLHLGVENEITHPIMRFAYISIIGDAWRNKSSNIEKSSDIRLYLN